jgi:hypothetical protein
MSTTMPRATVLALSAMLLAGWAATPTAVTITNLPAPGAFELRNDGPSEVSLARQVAVERSSGDRWERVPVPLELIEKCGETSTGRCVRLAANAVLRPVSWNGYSCAPQCPGSCRANIYLGPGKFRIVAATCDGKHQFTGPAFMLPAGGQ